MNLDTDVLIIGAGCSGLGLAVQLQRKLNHRNFIIIEKGDDVGGTWLANTYPGCGCDVPSHFYSYSFAANPDWSRAFSLQPEIQSYFRKVAEDHDIPSRIRFHSSVDSAVWKSNADEQFWQVTITNNATAESYTLRTRALVSGVGSLSVPKDCTIPGHDTFQGKLFHSARWDPTFDWTDQNVVVIGNGCSATQFVPVIASSGPSDISDKSGTPKHSGPAKRVTQFSRQAHYLAARENPYYSSRFKAAMRYVPFAMRILRGIINLNMELDFAGFYIRSGQKIRDGLAKENEAYVRRMAPPRYVDYLIPRHQIGCIRKVLDTDYLATLWRDNVELIADDPLERITPDGVLTESGRTITADAIVLATGFQTHKLLTPMEIRGEGGVTLEEHWDKVTSGTPSAYLGTLNPGFPNFFILMGPNTLTGHMSVIYTSECQILLTLGLLAPILCSSSPIRRLVDGPAPSLVQVTPQAADRDITTTHERLKDFVWSSGCTSWALDPRTGRNVAMYPHYQWHYWLRTLFLRGGDYSYGYVERRGKNGVRVRYAKLVVGFGWVYLRRAVLGLLFTVVVLWIRAAARRKGIGWRDEIGLLVQKARLSAIRLWN